MITSAKENEIGTTCVLPKGTEYVITATEKSSYASITIKGHGFSESIFGAKIFIPFPISADGKKAELTCDTRVVVKGSALGHYWTVAPEIAE